MEFQSKIVSTIKMAATRGSIAVLSYPSSYFSQKARPTSLSLSPVANQRRKTCCLAVQESSASTVLNAETKKEKKEAKKTEEEGTEKPKAAAAAKPLPQLMEDDVIPSLKAILQAQQHISTLQLSFSDNKLEGSFLNKGIPYSFWAFFSDGTITGPKGFAISSYGSGVSTVEPFLVDERKPTAKHVVFWVEKRLAAQGIIPVWRD